MPQVYEDLAQEGVISGQRADRLARLNSMRTRITHVYAHVTPEAAHAAIDEYLTTHHVDALRSANGWFQQRGYRLL